MARPESRHEVKVDRRVNQCERCGGVVTQHDMGDCSRPFAGHLQHKSSINSLLSVHNNHPESTHSLTSMTLSDSGPSRSRNSSTKPSEGVQELLVTSKHPPQTCSTQAVTGDDKGDVVVFSPRQNPPLKSPAEQRIKIHWAADAAICGSFVLLPHRGLPLRTRATAAFLTWTILRCID